MFVSLYLRILGGRTCALNNDRVDFGIPKLNMNLLNAFNFSILIGSSSGVLKSRLDCKSSNC